MIVFKEVKKDYIKLIREYGYPEDMTGGFVAEEHMEVVILNPSQSNARKYMVDVIQYGFQCGEFWNSEDNGKMSINDYIFINEMYNKYIIN